MKQSAYIVLLVLSFILGALLFRTCSKKAIETEPKIMRDTVIIRDTIRPPVPKPEAVMTVRYDTVRPQTNPMPALPTVTLPKDTNSFDISGNGLILPITRQTYNTQDYRAVIEGYKPRLVSIELYRTNVIVTNTVNKTRSPRWALTVGPGVGYGSDGLQPYVGVTLGFVLWSQ